MRLIATGAALDRVWWCGIAIDAPRKDPVVSYLALEVTFRVKITAAICPTGNADVVEREA